MLSFAADPFLEFVVGVFGDPNAASSLHASNAECLPQAASFLVVFVDASERCDAGPVALDVALMSVAAPTDPVCPILKWKATPPLFPTGCCLALVARARAPPPVRAPGLIPSRIPLDTARVIGRARCDEGGRSQAFRRHAPPPAVRVSELTDDRCFRPSSHSV